jgi:predicted nucleotidyltransferase
MLQKYSKYNVLQEFFDSPRKNFQMRAISRIIKLAQPSVSNYLKELTKEKLILKQKTGLYPIYIANRENELFKLYKKLNLIQRIQTSGLLSHVYDSCIPDCIILFGSASIGEDIEESDIDLFIQSRTEKINLTKFEKKLKRKINLFFEEDFVKLSKELKNNILNGIILRGYIKVF